MPRCVSQREPIYSSEYQTTSFLALLAQEQPHGWKNTDWHHDNKSSERWHRQSYLPILELSMIQGPPYVKPDLFLMRKTKRFWNEDAITFCPVKVIKYWILTFSGVLSSMGGRWKIPWQWGSRARGPDMRWRRGAQYWTSIDALVLEHTLNQRHQEGRKVKGWRVGRRDRKHKMSRGEGSPGETGNAHCLLPPWSSRAFWSQGKLLPSHFSVH